MKETTSTMWTFQMIIIFMLLFAAFLALILVYSKAFSIKNRFLSIIEKYDGITSESLQIMNNFARSHNYKAKAICPKDGKSWYGVDIVDDSYEAAKDNKRYSYCFSQEHDAKGLIYYNIVVFYRFNLPVLNSLGGYRIDGRSTSFRVSSDKLI